MNLAKTLLLTHLLPCALLLVPGCLRLTSGGAEDGGQDCTTEAIASVNIEVVDQAGAPIAPSSLVYTVDGGPEREAECMNADCSDAVAGWEETGVYVIVATLTDSLPTDPLCAYDAEDEVTVEVVMNEGGCHVDSEQVVLVLDTESIVCQ
jgi:hypothetical protein